MSAFVLITGGSSDIGAAITTRLACSGYGVIIHYHRDELGASALKQKLIEAGSKAETIKADISIEEEVENMFKFIDTRTGQLFGLVNNASYANYEILQNFEELDIKQLRRMLNVNVVGTINVSKLSVLRMKKTGKGSIVNITSQVTKSGGRGLAHYASTKGALATVTKSMANQLGRFNIRVNAVSPGLIRTDNNKALEASNEAALTSTVPIGRFGEPKDVAGAVNWLVSDESSYVTGTCIEVAGGR